MKRNCMLSVLVLLILSLAIGSQSAFGAAKFPEKPITLIVHSGAGGGSDIFARIVAKGLGKENLLPQPVVVENKPGGNGGIAFAYVSGKKKDPYYLLTAVSSLLTTNLQGLTQVSYKDFTPICNLVFDDQMFLMVGPNSKYKTMKQVVDFAKANPKTITLGGIQVGSADSIACYVLEKAVGIKFNYIVFNGQGELNAALLGGHVDMSFANPGEALDLYRAGKVKVLGVFGQNRLAATPEIPTMKEQGINVLHTMNRGLVAPLGIPEEARKTLEEAFFKYTKTESFRSYCTESIQTPAWMDSATFGKFIEEENVKYATILGDMGLIKKKK